MSSYANLITFGQEWFNAKLEPIDSNSNVATNEHVSKYQIHCLANSLHLLFISKLDFH